MPTAFIAIATSSIFVLLAAWHFRMALSGDKAKSGGESAAVPSVDGKPLFIPSKKSTILVGVALLCFAVLVAATAGILAVGLPAVLLTWLSYALALGLLARAVGDFKYVGFFKSVRGSRFAKMDTRFYSPLCTLLSAGVLANAIMHK